MPHMPDLVDVSQTLLLVIQVPLIAALYHNDCHFLAQQLLLLPHCYISLQQELEVSLDLQDAAAQLRQAGATCLRNLVSTPLRNRLNHIPIKPFLRQFSRRPYSKLQRLVRQNMCLGIQAIWAWMICTAKSALMDDAPLLAESCSV